MRKHIFVIIIMVIMSFLFAKYLPCQAADVMYGCYNAKTDKMSLVSDPKQCEAPNYIMTKPLSKEIKGTEPSGAMKMRQSQESQAEIMEAQSRSCRKICDKCCCIRYCCSKDLGTCSIVWHKCWCSSSSSSSK